MAGRNQKRTVKKLKIIPLGGLHEVGKNMTAFEYGNDIILVDCGMSFPTGDLYGIDAVLPDFSYVSFSKLRSLAFEPDVVVVCLKLKAQSCKNPALPVP